VSFSPDTAKTRTRTIRYRISDNYLRFYLKYVDPETEQIKKGIYQGAPLEALRAWDAIVGLQFENLILSNCNLLIAKIGLGNIPVVNAGPYFQAKTKKLPGCQIDLMLRTKGSIYVFEIKCRKEIKFAVVEEVKKKVAALHAAPSLSVRTGLIFQGVLDPEIEKSDYFDHIVPFEELLE
jgi:hypothetical protein